MPPSLPYIPRTIRTEDSIVHLEYDPQRLPAAPGPSWTRFVCISDTHARTFHVPDGDVLLHSGDITNLGIVKEFEDMAEWLYSLPHKVKMIVPKFSNYLLANERVKLVSYTSKTPHTNSKSSLKDVRGIYTAPPLTHGPPARILDLTRTEAFAGCAALRAQLPRIRPRIHVFGHIHEARGAHVHAWDSGRAGAGAVSYNKDDGHAGSDGEEQEGDGLPEVNDFPSDDDDDDDDLDDLDVHFDDEDVGAGDEGDEIDERGGDECPGKDTANRKFKTVFVNAANYPTGKGAWRATQRVPSGGPGFQAVIVDVRDY
ncbi:hypothetical protein H0H87_001555 [Tephrocybe sp. NHM501043]|nr:hypothetical protein H0H87_001555 [Tephrocybe sp. NHM501043]